MMVVEVIQLEHLLELVAEAEVLEHQAVIVLEVVLEVQLQK